MENDKKYIKAKRELVTSYHEAGHAVLKIIEGWPFESVSIVPDESSNGRVNNFDDTVMSAEYLRENRFKIDFRVFANLMSGAAALRVVFDRMNEGIEGDLREAHKYLKDILKAADLTERERRELGGALIAAGESYAVRRLREYRPALDEVAWELNKKKNLTFKEVQDIVNKINERNRKDEFIQERRKSG